MQEKISSLSDKTPVPLKWVFGVCSVVVALSMVYASNVVSDIRSEIKLMSDSVSKLNISVAVLLNDQNYSKQALEDLQRRVERLESKRH